MYKTILTGIFITLVAIIGVLVFTEGGKENNITNNTSSTSERINEAKGDENSSKKWKTFGSAQGFSREFTFQIPQNWESFIGPGGAETASVSFVLESKANFSGNFPPAGGAIAHAELALQGESLIDRFQDDSRVTQKSSEPVIVDEYEGSVYEWTISDGELTTQLDGYLAEGESLRNFKILNLPDIGNGETFILMIDSDIVGADRLFNIITNSIDIN